jgi:hypothetical protein
MNTLKLLSVGVLLASVLATPAMARKKTRHHHLTYATARSVSKGRCAERAPDVGAFASDPYTKPPCEPAGNTY